MLQRAKVIEIRGTKAVVDVYRSSACGENCKGSCELCKTARAVRAEAENTAGAAPGDLVELESTSSKVLGLAFILYIVPLLCGIAGYVIAHALGAGEGGSALAAFGGLALGFVPAMIENARAKRMQLVDLHVKRVLREDGR